MRRPSGFVFDERQTFDQRFDRHIDAVVEIQIETVRFELRRPVDLINVARFDRPDSGETVQRLFLP